MNRAPNFAVRPALLSALLFALALGLVVSFGIEGAGPERRWSPDSRSYVDSARSLLTLGKFSQSPERPDRPEILRTPGYPALLAIVWSVTGVSPLAASLVQVGLWVATLALAAALSRRLGGSPAVTAWLLALDLTLLVYTQKLLSETWFTFLLLVTAALAVRAVGGGASFRRFDSPLVRGLLVGICAAATAHIRPVAYLLGPLLGVALAGLSPRPARIPTALGVLLGWALLIGPWHARNLRVNDSAEFSVLGSIHLALCRAADIVALRDQVTPEEARRRIVSAVGDTTGIREGRCGPALRRVAFTTVSESPRLLLRVSGYEIARMLLIPGDQAVGELVGWPVTGEGPVGDLTRLDPVHWRARWLGEERPRLALAGAMSLHWVLLAGLAIWGGGITMRGGWRSRRSIAVAILLLVIAAPLATAAFAGCGLYARFRAPIDPLLAVLAGVGAVELGRVLRRPARLRPTSSS